MNKKRKSPLWMLVPMGVIIVVLSIVLIVITLKSGNQRTETASASHTQSGEKEEEPVNAADTVQENPKETDTGPSQVYVSPDISREVKDKVKSMSLEEKAAQLFFVTPEDITQVDAATVAGEDTKKA